LIQAIDKTSEPPLLAKQSTIDSLPLLYRVIADELIRKGRIIIEPEKKGREDATKGSIANKTAPDELKACGTPTTSEARS